MNQRLYLAVALGALLLAIVVLTTVIMVTLVVPGRQAASVGDQPPIATGHPERTEWREPTSRDAFDGVRRDPYRAVEDRPWEGIGALGSSEPDPRLDWRRDGAFAPGSSPDHGSVLDGYRFRPLEERELKRIAPEDYASYQRYTEGSRWRDDGFGDPALDRDAWTPDGFTSDWGASPYRFRPPDPPRVEPDPWRRTPSPQTPRGFTDPRLFETVPQWGATPPELPLPPPYMYPSLPTQDDHRLTTR
jgi:hypothetical protein